MITTYMAHGYGDPWWWITKPLHYLLDEPNYAPDGTGWFCIEINEAAY